MALGMVFTDSYVAVRVREAPFRGEQRMTEAEARQLLAVEETASRREVKAAYRRIMKTCHPDLIAPESAEYAEAITKTQGINAAYRMLGGRIKKRDHVFHPPTPLSEWYWERAKARARLETTLIWAAVIPLAILVIVNVIMLLRR